MTRVLVDELQQIGELLRRDGHLYHGNIVTEAAERIIRLHAALCQANIEWRNGLDEYEPDPDALLASEALLR